MYFTAFFPWGVNCWPPAKSLVKGLPLNSPCSPSCGHGETGETSLQIGTLWTRRKIPLNVSMVARRISWHLVSWFCLVKRSSALRGRNRTRNNRIDGSPKRTSPCAARLLRGRFYFVTVHRGHVLDPGAVDRMAGS